MKSPIRAIGVVLGIACLVVGLSAFGGCATTGTMTAQTSVFAIQQQYNHALQVGVWYGNLESCDAPTHDPVFCSKADIVVRIKNAKDVAGPAIAAAQATVRNPQFDQSTADKIVLSANAALAVMTAITEPLEALLGQAITAGKATPLSMNAHTPEMRAWSGGDHPMVMADVSLVFVLGLINALLKLLPEGTALWLNIKADKDKLDAIAAENRNPTDDEWASLNTTTADLEAQIDANAARAQGG